MGTQHTHTDGTIAMLYKVLVLHASDVPKILIYLVNIFTVDPRV